MAPTENVVRTVIEALLNHCEKFCTERAKTVMVRTGHLAALLDLNGNRPSYTLVGQVLCNLMYYLKREGVEVTVRGASNRKKYVLQCRDLAKIRKLLEKYVKT